MSYSNNGQGGLHFREMRVEDLDAVLEIERQSFPEPWTPGLFLHELKVPFSKTIVVHSPDAGDRLLGYVCWWVVGDEVHILNVAVCPARRKGGIGRALIELLMADGRAKGARTITLEVRRENHAAMALYASFGFTERGVRKNYYGRGHDAVIMSCTLVVSSTNGSADGNRAP